MTAATSATPAAPAGGWAGALSGAARFLSLIATVAASAALLIELGVTLVSIVV